MYFPHLRMSTTADSHIKTPNHRKWQEVLDNMSVQWEQLLPVAVLHSQPQDYLVHKQEVSKQNCSTIHMHSRASKGCFRLFPR